MQQPDQQPQLEGVVDSTVTLMEAGFAAVLCAVIAAGVASMLWWILPRLQGVMPTRPLRLNLLTLIAGGYLVVAGIFAVLAASNLTAAEAYDAVQGPLMALVGGSIALAKDLLRLDEQEEERNQSSLQPPDRPDGAGAQTGGPESSPGHSTPGGAPPRPPSV